MLDRAIRLLLRVHIPPTVQLLHVLALEVTQLSSLPLLAYLSVVDALRPLVAIR